MRGGDVQLTARGAEAMIIRNMWASEFRYGGKGTGLVQGVCGKCDGDGDTATAAELCSDVGSGEGARVDVHTRMSASLRTSINQGTIGPVGRAQSGARGRRQGR